MQLVDYLTTRQIIDGLHVHVGVVTQGLTHLGWEFISFLPFYLFSLRRHRFFCSPIILFSSLFVFYWIDKKQTKMKISGSGSHARFDTFGVFVCYKNYKSKWLHKLRCTGGLNVPTKCINCTYIKRTLRELLYASNKPLYLTIRRIVIVNAYNELRDPSYTCIS